MASKTRQSPGLIIMATKRAMKCYNITDVEIDTLGLAQGLSAFFFSVGTGLLTFCFEVTKDLMLVGGKNVETLALHFSVNHFGFPVAIGFYLLGGATFFFVGSTVRRIKRESEQC